jgi:hypothetical protein
MHLTILFLLLQVLHAHVSTATQGLSGSEHDWIYSPSGRMAFRINHNSTYRFALCITPAKDGRVVLELEFKVHSDVLRRAEVYAHVASTTHVGSRLPVRSTSAVTPLVLAKDFFGEDGRFEIWFVAEFKDVSQRADSHERFSARFTITCRSMPPPPQPMNSLPSLEADFPSNSLSREDSLSALFSRATNCITPTCLVQTYLRFHALALKHLQSPPPPSCPTPQHQPNQHCTSNSSSINFVIFRFIPGKGWGNSALLLMEAALFALSDWRVLLIDSSDHQHITNHLSSPFILPQSAIRDICTAAGVLLHTGRHMGGYRDDVYSSFKAGSVAARARLVVVEITDDTVLPGIHELAAANALVFPAVFDILPRYPYEYLGVVSRMVLQPSAAILKSILELKKELRSCIRVIGVHFRGGFVVGDFKLHENAHPTAIARVVQAARQAAEQQRYSADASPSSSNACFIVAGDNYDIRQFARAALESWGFTAHDISSPNHVISNVAVERNEDAARIALSEWFMLSSADTVIVQAYSSFGLSAGIHGGGSGFTVAEHRVINGFSCFPWSAAFL